MIIASCLGLSEKRSICFDNIKSEMEKTRSMVIF